MKYLQVSILTLGFLVFSGCSLSHFSFWESKKEREDPLMYIELQGTMQSEKTSHFSFSAYYLVNDSKEKIAYVSDSFESLDEYVGKKVLVKGEKVPSEKNILTLSLVQVGLAPESPIAVDSEVLGIKFVLSPGYTYTEEEGRLYVSKEETGEQFFTFFHQTDKNWQEKFLTQGENIVVQDFDVRRIYAGKRIQIYFPQYEIQVDYWGDTAGEYDFYSLLDHITLVGVSEREREISYSKKGKEKSKNQETVSDDTLLSQDENLSIWTDRVEKYMKKIRPNDQPSIYKISFYKNFIDVELFHASQKQRLVFKRPPRDTQETELEEVARYREGKIQSWDLISGETPILAGESEIFLIDIDDKKPVILPSNFALYLSTHYDFQVGYPRKMYYKASSGGANDEFLARVEWATTPLAESNADIRLEILEGNLPQEKVLREKKVILIPRDQKTHFKFSALRDNFSVVEQMRENFRSSK